MEVDGVRYWASWNEATGQYVVSENRADVGDAVLFSAQELNAEQRAQVQTNIGVKSAVDAVGAGDIRTIDVESEKQSDGLRNKVGVIESSSDYFYTNPIPVNKGDVVLLNNTFATTNVMPIAKVSSDNTFIKAIVAGITGVHDYYAVVQGGYISLCVAKSYIKGIQAFIVPCKLAQAISEPAGGYLQKFAETIGIVFNKETGFYEYAGITDLTEADIIKSIYFHTLIGSNTSLSYLYANLGNRGPRVFLPVASYNVTFGATDLMYNGSDAESIMLTYNLYAKFGSGNHLHMFRGCHKLKYVNYGLYIDVSLVTIASNLNLSPKTAQCST